MAEKMTAKKWIEELRRLELAQYKNADLLRVEYSHVYFGWPVYFTLNSNELPKYSGLNTDIKPSDMVYTLARFTTDYNPSNAKN